MEIKKGRLVLVPTPVGNLEDISIRAKRILEEADIVLAEDTRTSGILMKSLGISVKFWSYHQHNEHKVLDQICDRIEQGELFALITDAGTPAISDPGFLIVRACIERNLLVECLPGATAFVPALACSGLPTDRFVFEGFLPQKKGRNTRLESLVNEERTMVFYESPHKILKTLEQFKDFFGPDRKISVSREISKMFEEHIRGSIEELCEHFKTKNPKGEFVIVLAGK